ncbi:MAG: rhomboid family intramembrane serine protease [Planctomycetia bacterium]|nr:rhomboid family intramembrane serine protease [Planctomycetia bacterium]
MIPLRDNIPSRTLPVVNYAIIGVCALVFIVQLLEDPEKPSLVERLGMVPARITDPSRRIEAVQYRAVRTSSGIEVEKVSRPMAQPLVPAIFTLVTCVFLHGGWMHFLGNMWFLWIFGDNVEDRFGHWTYLGFYLAWGVAASAAHLAVSPGSEVPTIGASGAIAGVMGAYLILYPKAMVLTLVPLGYFMEMLVLPAALFLGIWFVIQFFQGALSILSTQATGVAWWAHIGGFAAGMAVVGLLKAVGFLSPPVETVRPGTDHVTYYQVRPGRRGW